MAWQLSLKEPSELQLHGWAPLLKYVVRENTEFRQNLEAEGLTR